MNITRTGFDERDPQHRGQETQRLHLHYLHETYTAQLSGLPEVLAMKTFTLPMTWQFYSAKLKYIMASEKSIVTKANKSTKSENETKTQRMCSSISPVISHISVKQ